MNQEQNCHCQSGWTCPNCMDKKDAELAALRSQLAEESAECERLRCVVNDKKEQLAEAEKRGLTEEDAVALTQAANLQSAVHYKLKRKLRELAARAKEGK